MRTRVLVAALAAASLGSGYGGPPLPNTGNAPPPPAVGIEQRLGAQVPLDLPLRDSTGKRVTLGDCVAGKPTILVLAYYRCPMLCGEVFRGLNRTLKALPDTAGGAFNVVVVSFDPREKPPLAALKKAHALEDYGREGADMRFLTGDPLAVATLTDAVGFGTQYDPKTEQYAHGSGLMVLSPDGTVSRYLLGVKFAPRDLRLALSEASDGKVGSPVEDAALLLCYQYDPSTGTYTVSVLRLLRLFSAVTVVALGALVGGLFLRGRARARTGVGS